MVSTRPGSTITALLAISLISALVTQPSALFCHRQLMRPAPEPSSAVLRHHNGIAPLAGILAVRRDCRWFTDENHVLAHRAAELFWTSRSEERRVGKECRSRWSPYH